MILDVKGGKMQIMFIRVVCGRIILRCLIVKTIIFDSACLWRAPAICGVFVPKSDLERKWRISHKQPLKHKCRKRQINYLQ